MKLNTNFQHVYYHFRKIWENSSYNGCKEMLKCKAVRVVSKFLTSKCKDIVIAVLRAQDSFLSNSANVKHRTNLTFIILQVNYKNKPISKQLFLIKI